MKVILITPYSGTNLGDAAIQESAIHGLRAWRADVDIQMVSLAPIKTTSLHNIPSFPITSLEIPLYSTGIRSQHDTTRAPSADSDLPKESSPLGQQLSRTLKSILTAVPVLFRAIRFIVRVARAVGRTPRIIAQEVRHYLAAKEFSKNTDLIIVSGGGQIDDLWGGCWGQPYSLLKWSLVARAVGAKFVVLSVGVGVLESAISRTLVREALRRATYRSYRDEQSAEMLSEWQFTAQDHVFPDLAFALPSARTRRHPVAADRPRTIGIAPIAYGRSNCPRPDPRAYQKYISTLVQFTKRILSAGYDVELFLSDILDRHTVREVFEALASDPDIDVARRLRQSFPQDIDALFDALHRIDLVVASRLHGVILSQLAGKPTLALSYDRKVATHMHSIGQQNNLLEIEGMSAEVLETQFKALAANLEKTRQDLAHFQTIFSGQVSSQYRDILAMASE